MSAWADPAPSGEPLFKRPSRRLVVVISLTVGWGAFTAYRIWQSVIAPPAVWQDSLAYRAVSKNGLFSSSLWTGERSPLVPLLMKATDQFRYYRLAQALLASLAWGLLALTAARLVKPGWRQVVTAWVILGFATAPLIVQWDWSALSESPSLSTLAVLCACGIWLVDRFSWVRLGVLGVAALVYVGLRDADIWSMATLGLVVLGVGLYETIRGAALGPGTLAEMVRGGWHRTRRWVLVGIVLVSVSAFAGIGAFTSHRNVVNIEGALYVRIFPFPDRVSWFSAHGMPEGPAIDAQAQSSPPASKTSPKVVGIDLASPNWAPLRDWFHHQAFSTYVLFLAMHPGYVVSAPFASPPLTFNNASGDLSFYLPKGHDPLPVLGTIFTPSRILVTALSVVGLVFGARRRMWHNRESRFLIVFVLAGFFSMLLAWHGEGMEATRHMLEGNVEVRLGVLLLFLLGVLGYRASLPASSDELVPLEVGTVIPTSSSSGERQGSEQARVLSQGASNLWSAIDSEQTTDDSVWNEKTAGHDGSQ
jgi:hypothetical protein